MHNLLKQTVFRTFGKFGGREKVQGMKIKIDGSTVTAPASVLNILSSGYSSLASFYLEEGNISAASECEKTSSYIFKELQKAGYYNDSSKTVIRGYFKIDQKEKEGKFYELWESERFGEDVAALVRESGTGAIVGTTFDSLADFLTDLEQ